MLIESVAKRIQSFFTRQKKPIVVWGLGKNGREVVSFLKGKGIPIAHIVDKRYKLLGAESPAILEHLAGDLLVVVTMGNYDFAVNKHMKNYGFEEGTDYIWAFMGGRNFYWQGTRQFEDDQGNTVYSTNCLLDVVLQEGSVGNTIYFADACHSEKPVMINVNGSYNRVYICADKIYADARIMVEGDCNRLLVGKGCTGGRNLSMTLCNRSIVKIGDSTRLGEDNVFLVRDGSRLFVGRNSCIEGRGNIGITDNSLFSCKRRLLFRGAYCMDSKWKQIEIRRKCAFW